VRVSHNLCMRVIIKCGYEGIPRLDYQRGESNIHSPSLVARSMKWSPIKYAKGFQVVPVMGLALAVAIIGLITNWPLECYAHEHGELAIALVPHELVYFYTPQCPRCKKTDEFLQSLEREYAGIISVTKCDMSTPEGEAWRQTVNQRFEVADSMALAVPAVFFSKPFIGETNIISYLETEIISFMVSQRKAELGELEGQVREEEPVGQLQTLAWVPIAMAGALDGVNPCAFGMLIFLVVTLSLTKGQLRVFITGFMFCLAAFLTNFSIGLGVVSLSSMTKLALVGRLAYLVGSILAFTVGMASLIDWRRSRGKLHTPDPVLGLPKSLRSLSKGIIRKWNETRLSIMYPLLAFGTGTVVALIEFPCTGQVYLPTIAFMLGNPHYKYRATSYLVLYNLMYVLPLVAVLVLSVWLAEPRRVARYFCGKIYLVKLVTGCFFLLLSGYMFYQQLSW
jgi:thiol-disulfide isomerase/thioredoxin